MSSLRKRRTPSGDEGTALLFVVVAMLILASLSVLALGAIIGQVSPTQYQGKANLTINAAQAGMNTALGAIREATYVENTITYGDRSKVPCWKSHTGTLAAPQSGTASAFSVSIQYFKSDPSKQTPTWRDQHALSCVPGIGTPTTPSFALITSVGGAPALPNLPEVAGNRTLQGTYTLNVTSPNLPGGLIKDASGLCYIGGLAVGAGVTVGTCSVGADAQMWSYNTSYELVLTATMAADGSGGLCLSATPPSANSNPVAVVMKACVATDYTQRWGVNGNNPVHLFGHLTGLYAKTWCLGSATPGSAGASAMADTNSCNTATAGVIPEAAVGAGAAGTTVKTVPEINGKPFQWVNYQEFGRCFDINAWNVNGTVHIVYPCKQDPLNGSTSAASPGWNEVFTYNSTTQFFYANVDPASNKPSDPNNPAYCMKSPNKVGGFVTFGTKCANVPATGAAPYEWTVNRDTGLYATSYTIVDAYGRCLANGPGSGSYSAVITNTCDGSGGQKWNAPPGFTESSLSSVIEASPAVP